MNASLEKRVRALETKQNQGNGIAETIRRFWERRRSSVERAPSPVQALDSHGDGGKDQAARAHEEPSGEP
jgi:hypothetical protein